MRVIRFKGKTAYLKERHWKQLIRRFNPTEEELEEGFILKDCVLCSEFKGGPSGYCEDCPLSAWKHGTVCGCVFLLNSVIA